MAKPLVFREHALDRMLEWDVDVSDVEAVLETGETIEEYDDGARLVMGRAGIRPLHVVVRTELNTDEVFVITVYEPRAERWDARFMRRMR